MPVDPELFQTGGALQGAVAASLLRQRERASELAPGDRIGIYRVCHELGRGGMAIVYLAERDDGEYRQRVALKWMHAAHADGDAEVLFRRERQALADLRHPHIAQLLDGGRTEEGRLWFVMEYIDGAPLHRHCEDQALSLRQRLALFLEVCSAVAFAHAHGVIHRDIKPSNVMVDGDSGIKLLDFGISLLAGEAEGPGIGAFTPGFASPEQQRGETVTVASDVYQLGRLLMCMLAPRATSASTVAGPAGAETDADTESPSRLPADLDAIVRRARHRLPDQRYPTADALAADVEAFLARRPVAARRATAGYRAMRIAQRPPFALAVSAGALAVIVAMGTFSSLRIRAERDVARQQRDIAAAERDRARQALATTDAINRFLNEDLLDAANPQRRAPDEPDVTVRQALDNAEAQVDARFGSRPAVARQILATLAELRYEFGEYGHSLALYERALRLPGIEPADEVALHTGHATVLISMQQPDAAAAELAAALPAASARFGDGDVRVLKLRQRWLEARSALNTNPDVIAELEALRARATRALGPHNEISGEIDLAIADFHRTQGHPERGLDNAARAHEALRVALGEDNTSTLKALVMLAHAQNAGGRADEAIARLREAHRLQRARYGADDGDALFMQNELAFVLAANGRYAEAEPLLDELVELWSARWGADSPQIVPMLKNQALVRMRLGHAEQALPVVERAVQVMDISPGLPAWVHVVVRGVQADILRALGRLGDARIALRRGLEKADAAALAEDDLRRLGLRAAGARLLMASGDPDAAISELDATIELMRRQVDERHPLLRQLLNDREVLRSAAAPKASSRAS